MISKSTLCFYLSVLTAAFLDGATTPAIESPMSDILGGKYPGLPRPIAGENTITFTMEGANPKAVKSYMVGLDYLLLTPAP